MQNATIEMVRKHLGSLLIARIDKNLLASKKPRTLSVETQCGKPVFGRTDHASAKLRPAPAVSKRRIISLFRLFQTIRLPSSPKTSHLATILRRAQCQKTVRNRHFRGVLPQLRRVFIKNRRQIRNASTMLPASKSTATEGRRINA
jgi:hypothetical protein